MQVIEGDKIDIKWQLKLSMALENQHSLLYRSEYKDHGIQMEVHTPKYKNGEFGEGKVSYFIDGDKREFKDKNEFIKILRNRFQMEE
jgi:hypothetical protein